MIGSGKSGSASASSISPASTSTSSPSDRKLTILSHTVGDHLQSKVVIKDLVLLQEMISGIFVIYIYNNQVITPHISDVTGVIVLALSVCPSVHPSYSAG